MKTASGDFLADLDAYLERDWLVNLSQFSAFIFQRVENLNWAGFYLLRDDKLILGPFQGKPACSSIEIGRGVCGRAAQDRQVVVVDDVEKFPGHITCDSASRSEIVIPLIVENRLLGVFDVDSPILSRFDFETESLLKQACARLLLKTEWQVMKL